MSCPFGPDEIAKLKTFINLCSTKPEILNIPQLEFFKNFIEKLGGKVPAGEFKIPPSSHERCEAKTETKMEADPPEPEEDEDPESDIELDMTGVIDGDTDEAQSMGDSAKEPTEEEIDEASDFRSKAAAAYSEQNFQEAINLYTKAIELNPTNALFHAKRGQAYLKLQKPNACIRDCERALELNCDSAAAYKFRGRAYRLLGDWESAAKDLRQACKLDFDEETDEWLKEVTPNAKKLEQHKIKQERKKAERELQKRQERLRKAQEANRKAQEEQQQQPPHGNVDPPSGGAAGAGGGGGGMPNLGNLFGNLNQSEILSAFSDPEVAAAMQDIMANPSNITKYQSNPKIMSLITKIGSAMGGGAGGFPGAGGGGFPGAGGAGFPGAANFPGAGGFPGTGFSTGASDAPPNENEKKPSRPDFTDDGLD